jgi:hypothetical protein
MEVNGMVHKIAGWTVVALTALLCYTSIAEAQWVLLGRKALGVINSLSSQGREREGHGYDVAAVLLEANADKVYSTAVELLKGNPNLTINHREDAGREIEFTDGKLLVGMKVSKLEDHLSQLLISSVVTSGKPGGTSFVVEKIFQVCEKMAVQCMLAKD